jgi:hypothetical protein
MASTLTDISDEKSREAIDKLATSVLILSRSIMNRLMGYDDDEEYEEQL